MAPSVFRYRFDPAVPIPEVEHTLLICLLAVQSLHGDAGARLAVGHHLDRRRRTLVVDGRTAEGRDLAKLVTGFLSREFGPTSFRVEPAEPRPVPARREHDPREYRTLGGWAEELDLDPARVAEVLATDPALTLDSPLTLDEVHDLVGLPTRRPEPAR
jgi:hypothetical protein